MPRLVLLGLLALAGAATNASAQPAAARAPEPGPVDFTPHVAELLATAACGAGAPSTAVAGKLHKAHCDFVTKAQQQYRDKWIVPARAFFSEHVPKDAPKKVVYPFAGGDLSTALTVYPDADEITTISLEPSGDPRSLRALPAKALAPALEQVRKELRFLYVVNFSNTKNMIEAMRGGRLPTQLIFGLSALHLHGYELVGARYFAINEDGSLRYLDQRDVDGAGDPAKPDAGRRNRIFNNVEIQFRRPGQKRVQIYRHIEANLDDNHLTKDPRVLRHLEAKGEIAGMTKAASYLMSWDVFSKIRGYLLGHVRWMVSDATGVHPKWGTPAGFSYELWGVYEDAHMEAGRAIAREWRKEWANAPQRPLPFRFGYPDRKQRNHLVIMRKTAAAPGK